MFRKMAMSSTGPESDAQLQHEVPQSHYLDQVQYLIRKFELITYIRSSI